MKILWDAFRKTRGEDGDIVAKKIPPPDVFFDPYASNDHRGRDCRYIIHRMWQTPEAIIGKYGEKGKIALNIERTTEKDQPKSKVGRIWSMFAGLTTEELRSGMNGGGGNDNQGGWGPW